MNTKRSCISAESDGTRYVLMGYEVNSARTCRWLLAPPPETLLGFRGQ